MPIEIRELIIKTEIVTTNAKNSAVAKERELSILRKQLLEECKRLIAEKNQENSYKR
ncbi:hypothetical protein CLU81_0177 [Flavobacterium sp. 9]|jgi:hypothetical protein|uniref:DUF5908 family protein n=1 Tax=unclassified Flavobacterium TaxID=196869 RepID=UPI000C616134|nr:MULTISPECIES: DUF5908 family protein [unclassified Flavobacterium]PIF29793.1 hypothetical protein CLU81_0177 [Flavobacterium sp. 9]RKR04875.1 hypothetical protein C8C82_4541 [Flavobacterium sp. 81]TCK56195.1 hypothetical protein C8C83_4207 [Flavobacterium sp. 90]